MKKKLYLIFFIIFFINNIKSNEIRTLDVSIVLDISENPNSENDAITQTLAIGLCQKASPIITTTHLMNNVLTNKISNKPEFQIQLNQWDIYKTISDDYVLLIPKKYLDQKIQDKIKLKNNLHKEKNTADEILIGFKIDPSSKILSKIPIDVINNLKTTQAIDSLFKPTDKINLINLTRIFTQGKNEIYGKWNIYLTGHGFLPLKIEDLNQYIKNKTINESEDTEFQIAGLSLIQFVDFLQFLTEKINTNFFYYFSCYAGDINAILPYMPLILNKNGNYRSVLKKPNFIIVSGALTSQVVRSWITTYKDAPCPFKDQDNGLNFINFFKYLTKYNNYKILNGTLYNDNQLKGILNAITPLINYDPHNLDVNNNPISNIIFLANIPLIKFPSTDIFRAFALNDRIAILSQALAKKHELENMPLQFKDKEAILIYPENVKTNLEIEYKTQVPTIVSMIPLINLIRFNQIITNIKFSDFLIQTIGGIKPLFKKYFYIKKLTIINDLELKSSNFKKNEPLTLDNVFIATGSTISEIKSKKLLTPKVEMFFTGPNNHMYYLNLNKSSYSIETFKESEIIKKSENNLINAMLNYRNLDDKFYDEISQFLSKKI